MRVCNDDRDLECVSRLGEDLLREVPDEPALHFMLANLRIERGEDPSLDAPEHVAFAEAFGSEPGNVELVRLSWAFAAYRYRVRTELPGTSLIAARRALLDGIAAFEPERDSEETRAMLLELAVYRTDETDPTAAALRLLPRLEEIGDTAALFLLAVAIDGGADADPLLRAEQRALIDRVLDSDPASPRYPGYLILDASARSGPEAIAALDALLPGGLPPWYADDAWVLYAGLQAPRGEIPGKAGSALLDLLLEDRRRNSTANAAYVLSLDLAARGFTEDALLVLEEAERRFGVREVVIDVQKADLLSRSGRHEEALLTLQGSLRRGGTDYRRWFAAAREHQVLGNAPEAVRLYQFYLAQVKERAADRLPFGPAAPVQKLAEAHAKVWYRVVEIHPAFFGRWGVRQFMELLALLAAGLLAAARMRRARAFLLPGLFCAEIVFFAGLVALRLVADGAAVPVLSWLWLGSASLRAFVLVAAGLYVSALAGLPRRTRAIVAPSLAAGAAAVAGAALGLTDPPLFVIEGMPGFARVAELGLAPERAADVPVLVVSALRMEGAARLVWPALLLMALPDRGRFALRSPHARAGVAVACAALLCSAGSPGAFAAAALGAALLTLARLRWGAVAPFVLHGAFAGGAAIGSFLHP